MTPFASMSEIDLHRLAPHGYARSFAKSMTLIYQNDSTELMYVLLSGSARVFVTDDNGREIDLGTVHAGDYVGELVLDGGLRSASVMSLEPLRCFVIPRDDLETLIQRYPAFALDLIRRLSLRVRNLTDRVAELNGRSGSTPRV
jgi:CRP/FNR family cyclic AMP-dependent transcriptional regulator